MRDGRYTSNKANTLSFRSVLSEEILLQSFTELDKFNDDTYVYRRGYGIYLLDFQ